MIVGIVGALSGTGFVQFGLVAVRLAGLCGEIRVATVAISHARSNVAVLIFEQIYSDLL